MAQMPIINAMAIGSKKPMVVLNSGTVNPLDEHELRTVLGARGRAHPLRPRALHDGAVHPAPDRRPGR